MSSEPPRRDIVQSVSGPIQNPEEESNAARLRRLRWRSQHDTMWRGDEYVTSNRYSRFVEHSTNNLHLLDANWVETGNPLTGFSNGCWRYTFAIQTSAMVVNQPYRSRFDSPERDEWQLRTTGSHNVQLFSELEVRPKNEGDGAVNNHVVVAPRRTPNQFRFINGHNLTQKINDENEEIGLEGLVEHLASLYYCPERFTSNRTRNLWPMEACRLDAEAKPARVQEGILLDLGASGAKLVSIADFAHETFDVGVDFEFDCPNYLDDGGRYVSSTIVRLAEVGGIIFDLIDVGEVIDEWLEPPPETGSENKLRFWERYPPHEGGFDYGPITGGFLVFDA